MNPHTGQIHNFVTYEDLKAKEAEVNQRLVPMTEQQAKKAEPMTASGRKGYMRNQPCPCGSEKKFKKCCWDDYAQAGL